MLPFVFANYNHVSKNVSKPFYKLYSSQGLVHKKSLIFETGFTLKLIFIFQV